MDERTLIFQKVQKGEMIFTLEKDRRSGYPIFDTARIVKVGESKLMASGAKDGFVNSVELVIQDSVSQLTVYLPSQSDEGIYNGVYYTTDVVNIINEVTMQKHNALNILNNRPKFEAIVSECDNILNSINQSPSAPSKPAHFHPDKALIQHELENLCQQIRELHPDQTICLRARE